MGSELQPYSVVCTFYILLLTAFRSSKVSITPQAFSWALSIYEKNREISVVAKVEFPIGKKLFHFSGNFPVGRTDETCSIYRRTGNSGNFD